MNKKTNFNNFKDFGNWCNQGQKTNPIMDNNQVSQKIPCPICDMDHTTNNCPQSNTDLEVK